MESLTMNLHRTLRIAAFALATLLAVVLGLMHAPPARASAPAPAGASATPTPPPPPKVIPIEQVEKQFVGPAQLVDVGGRRLNLRCMGALRDANDVTVVFDSGLSDWSNAWPLVQPAVATLTRACSYDRAGLGHSDPSPRPPTAANMVDDLHTLLQRAGITGRVLLVGHSLGGFTAKLYARTYPKDVAGLVMVDGAEENMVLRTREAMVKEFGEALVAASAKEDAEGLAGGVEHFRACAAKARAGTLGPDTEDYRRCTDPPRLPHGQALIAERRVIQPGPHYQHAQAEELAYSMYIPQPADAKYLELFGGEHPLGDVPMLVLTATVYDMAGPYGYLGYRTWHTAHEQTAALSSRGEHREVGRSRHNMQMDHPQAIVNAVTEILAKARGG
jgi:pimeloyl-ACP methyl ester carboxylesterase